MLTNQGCKKTSKYHQIENVFKSGFFAKGVQDFNRGLGFDPEYDTWWESCQRNYELGRAFSLFYNNEEKKKLHMRIGGDNKTAFNYFMINRRLFAEFLSA